MQNEFFTTLFKYKAWADGQLHDAVASLPIDFDAADKHTALRILNHIYVVDRIFVGNLTGKSHGYTATNTPETPELNDLSWVQQESDKWYLDFVAAAAQAALSEPVKFTFVDGDSGSMTRAEMLTHVIAHGTYHRGAVGRILAAHSIAAPRDLFTKFLHETQPQRRSA